jgi:hypothetical protein
VGTAGVGITAAGGATAATLLDVAGDCATVTDESVTVSDRLVVPVRVVPPVWFAPSEGLRLLGSFP